MSACPPGMSCSYDVPSRRVVFRMGPHVLGRAPQPLVQRHGGRPAKRLAGTGRIAQEQVDFALLGADALRRADDAGPAANCLEAPSSQVADADRFSLAEVDDLPLDRWRRPSQNE